MPFDPSQWQRFEFEGTPIYVRPDPPCWFVPNDAGDGLLKQLSSAHLPVEDLQAQRFFHRLPDASHSTYAGRSSVLELTGLRELWFHLTNRCNLRCTHCLFGSSPEDAPELSAARVLQAAEEAARLGCRVFGLTGGEPLVHPHFSMIVEKLLALQETHVVVLTNGLLARRVLQRHAWDYGRLHLQISLDGLERRHDVIRGSGTFARTVAEMRRLASMGVPFTVSVCPTRRNLDEIVALVDLAADVGAANLHFMWYFVRGRGTAEQFVAPSELFPVVRAALERAERRGLTVDNIQALSNQVFAPAGTRHDGSGMAWESLALGPDGRVYPSAALVGVSELASDWRRNLEEVWRNSPVLDQIRRKTAEKLTHPLRFVLGGGDPDHSYLRYGVFLGADPYGELHEKLALWLIARRAPKSNEPSRPALRLKMGDRLEACDGRGGVALTHSNCLLAMAAPSKLRAVRDYYRDAATDVKHDIQNPVGYPSELLAHIPEPYRVRGYGCGSPVVDAGVRPGETVVDLGCGTGVECLMASRLVGPTGRVIGIDMLETMLRQARAGTETTAQNLGYANVTFLQSLLETLPLKDAFADLVISNCVLNLSGDKRQAFAEIFRILRPGGHLVVSDVVCDEEPEAAIRNDPVLHGECIGGALTQRDLVGLLEEAGFGPIRLIKRFPYRRVHDHPFYSLTFEAYKPASSPPVAVVYRGPFAAAQSPSGMTLVPGPVYRLPRWEAEALEPHLFLLDGNGAVTNQEAQNTCGCAVAPEAAAAQGPARGTSPVGGSGPGVRISLKRQAGCMVCGAPLVYRKREAPAACVYCGRSLHANALCENGHFVCDTCHSADALTVIEHVSLASTETDLIALLDKIRCHPAFPVHGPEHHALVPAVIIAAARNAGERATDDDVRAALRRGAQIPGGTCGFMGCCGAAVGVGIAFSILIQANPVKPWARRLAQQATQAVLAEIAGLEAARCCQREAWIALRKAAALFADLLDRPLRAEHPLRCRQQAVNPECLGAACPVHKSLNGQAPVALSV